ncbi:MAG: ABC-2 transporter permease [Saccharofermentans sp.]|nr:ABC-2 transporter permease [Saccharofermentans sp.]
MLGLLVKDLRLALTRKYALLIILVIALIMGTSMEGPFIIGYVTMIALMLAVGTIMYDEMDNGYDFIMTMPLTRKTYVRGKYLFCLLSALVAWLVGAILTCAAYIIRQNASALLEDIPISLVLIPVLFILPAVMIPLQLKLGAERSRIATYIIFGFIAGLIFMGKKLLDESDLPAKIEPALNSFPPVAVVVAITAFGLLVTFISYLCSVRIMMKKEF